MNKRITSASQSGCLPSVVYYTIAATVIGLIGEFSNIEEGPASKIVSAFLLIYFGLLGWAIKNIILGKINEKAKINEVLRTDTRTPILYLRSFISDKHTHDLYNVNESIAMINPYYLIGRALAIRITFEQQLAFHLNQVGPFIALSAPGNQELMLGASRLAPITEGWHKVINGYLEQCNLIIVRVGDSDGLKWELEQIVKKECLNRLIIYLQFPGPQDSELLEARFRRFSQYFTKLAKVNITQGLEKNRYLYFINRKPELSKTLPHALNRIGFNVEISNYRSLMKGMLPGADNSFKKPSMNLGNLPNVLRYFLFFLASLFTTSLNFGIIAGILSVWENCPGTLILVSVFWGGVLGSVIVSRMSILFNIAGDSFHILWGIVLMLFSIYSFFTVIWRSWDFFGTLNLLASIEPMLYLSLLLHLLSGFIWIPFIYYFYSWSKAEQKRI